MQTRIRLIWVYIVCSGSAVPLFFGDYSNALTIIKANTGSEFERVLPMVKAKSADPDQIDPFDQSDQGLHCLPKYFCPLIMGNMLTP